jgi:4-alpha-glucanotransferase
LVTVNTHDHPPLAAIWEGRDIELAQELGLVEDERELSRRRHARERELRALLRRLVREGCLRSVEGPHSYAEICRAVHAFLSKTPSPLLGVRIGDLLGEVEPLNIPGIGHDGYRNWSRRLSSDLEGLREDPVVARGLSGVADRRISEGPDP